MFVHQHRHRLSPLEAQAPLMCLLPVLLEEGSAFVNTWSGPSPCLWGLESQGHLVVALSKVM